MVFIKKFIAQKANLIIMAIFAAIMIVFHQLIFLYGDDYFYGTFHLSGLFDFFKMHTGHYTEINGRAIIHLLVTFLLIFDIYIWRFINPLIILLTLYFLSKIVLFRKTADSENIDFTSILIASIGLFLLIGVDIARESIYWLTGSINYLYPIFMLSWAVYIFNKSLSDGKKHYFLPLLCFFASATTEQTGIMTAGLLIMVCTAKKLPINSERENLRLTHYISTVCAIIGYLTVVLAPGTFHRWDTEKAGFSFENLINSINFFFTTPQSVIFIILTAISAIYLLNKLSRELYTKNHRKNIRIINICVKSCLSLILAFYLFVIVTNPTLPNDLIFWVAVLILIFITYNFTFYFIIRNNILPFAFFIVAVGAQIAMSVISTVYYRTLLCSVLALIVPIITGISELNKKISFLASLALSICGIFIFVPVFNGYAENAPVNRYNLEQIKEFQRESGSEYMVIKPMSDNTYCWDMLYTSSYHIAQFEKFYRLPENTVYIDFPEEGLNRLYLNNSRIITHIPPMYSNKDESLCIAVRDIAQKLGYMIDWNDESGSIIINTGDKKISISTVSGYATVDENYIGEYMIFNHEGRSMIELDFYKDAFNFDIDIIPNENKGFDIFVNQSDY